jgi:hypothetical protein
MTKFLPSILACAAALAAMLPVRANHPAAIGCEGVAATNHRYEGVDGVPDPDGDVRVYAIQYEHEIRHVVR